MAEKDVWGALDRVISAVGVLAGLVALGVIAWYVAQATHLVPRMPSGFFAA